MTVIIEEDNICINDYVEIVFDYFTNYDFNSHKHEERIYFAKVVDIKPKEHPYSTLYILEGFQLKFYIDDLKKIN